MFPLFRGYPKPAAGLHLPHLHPDYISSLKRAPSHDLIAIPQTLSEVTGPAFDPRNVSIFMRGLLDRLMTRVYFLDEESNRSDEILHLVDPARRATLLARPGPEELDTYEWNIVLQGLTRRFFSTFEDVLCSTLYLLIQK
jgi:protocatechuate 3,4-dioxygenase beta subunit